MNDNRNMWMRMVGTVLLAITLGCGAQPESTGGNGNGSLADFNRCLAAKGMIIYGANWCGYTRDLVALLGGYEEIQDLYVECTMDEARCDREMIENKVPEIQLNGVKYKGPRTLEALSNATGCIAPVYTATAVDQGAGSKVKYAFRSFPNAPDRKTALQQNPCPCARIRVDEEYL